MQRKTPAISTLVETAGASANRSNYLAERLLCLLKVYIIYITLYLSSIYKVMHQRLAVAFVPRSFPLHA